MADTPDEPTRPETAAEMRARRLAAELRANLQRRKQQARGRDAVAAAPASSPDGEES